MLVSNAIERMTYSSSIKQQLTDQMETKKYQHTAASIRWSSPTQLLISRSEACRWQSGRDAEYSSVCGRM